MRSTFVILLAASACLAGCNAKPGGTAASGQAAAAASATEAASAAPAMDGQIPHMKPGLWEASTSVTMDGRSMMSMGAMKICIDQTSDRNESWKQSMSDFPPECAKHDLSRDLDGTFALHMTCTQKNGQSVKLDVRVSGDFSTIVRIDSTTTVTERNGAAHAVHTIYTQTRVGDCAPGQKAGPVG
jgi:hypothetical protein